MGLFDHVHIETELLPLTKDEKDFLDEVYYAFQTKDYFSFMHDIFIIDNHFHYIENDLDPHRRKNYIRDDEFTGNLNFYNYIEKDNVIIGIEFMAFFKKGELQYIQLIKFEDNYKPQIK